MKQYLGIDIGGTAVKLGIVDELGNVLFTHTQGVAFDQYNTPIIKTVKRSIHEFFNLYQISSKDLEGIGVSATGQIDHQSGIVIGVGGNIKNWCGTDIKRELEQAFHLKTTVVNDANCMIMGEKWLGRGKGYRNIIGITIGTGVGGGIIIGNQLLHGTRGIAGEIGHFSIDHKGELCTCGNVGCYEQYASITALVKKVKENEQELNLSVTGDEINGEVIFKALAAGNKKIQKLVEEWVTSISKGLISLVHLFNPQLILIGGGVCTQEEYFIKPIRSYVLNHVMNQFSKDLEIAAATLGNQAGLVGAIYYHLQQE